jgi:Holliday junction resolvase-like predicted endonuclease
VKQNWRRVRLEADVVAVDGRAIVIIEVKTRHVRFRSRYPARRAVHAQKRGRLCALARSFARNNGPLCRRFGLAQSRIDAVEVYFRRTLFGMRRVSAIIWHRDIA